MKNSQPKSNKGLIAVMVLIIVVILILSGVVGYMGNNHRRRDYRRAYHSGADMGGSRYRRHEG